MFTKKNKWTGFSYRTTPRPIIDGFVEIRYMDDGKHVIDLSVVESIEKVVHKLDGFLDWSTRLHTRDGIYEVCETSFEDIEREWKKSRNMLKNFHAKN